MRVAHWPDGAQARCDGSVATVGVFDGVHKGHKKVIGRALEEARGRAVDAAIVTFDRHPSAVVRRRAEPFITSLEHRLLLFEKLGADLCLVVDFTEEVAQIPAREFAGRVFDRLLSTELLVLGFDCRFGRGAEGDIDLLREMGFEAVEVPPVEVGGEVVSSTAIRRAVTEGDFARAECLLGRPFSLYGTVVAGERRGRQIGIPTANLDLHNETVPPDGVYATWTHADGGPLRSVTSVGRQPTFPEGKLEEPVVEVHLIDRRMDLYGQHLEVKFVERLRGQQAFETPEELTRQIERDIEEARRLLRGRPNAG